MFMIEKFQHKRHSVLSLFPLIGIERYASRFSFRPFSSNNLFLSVNKVTLLLNQSPCNNDC